MYGRKNKQDLNQPSGKNPNRVTGGLKGQGVDHVVNLQKEKKALNMPSKIFKVGSNGEILTIRK